MGKVRSGITELLFQLLPSPEEDVVNLARDGIAAAVVDPRNIPKRLLQVLAIAHRAGNSLQLLAA